MFTNANVFPAYLALFKVALRQMFWTRRTVLILIGCALIACYRSHIPVYSGR